VWAVSTNLKRFEFQFGVAGAAAPEQDRARQESGMPGDHAMTAELDFRSLFEAAPQPYLVLDAAFNVVAVNDAHLAATMTTRQSVIGRHLFAVFPDNPADRYAEGLNTLRNSLLRVLKTRKPDHMPPLRYAIERRQGGVGYEERYWDVVNTPVLGEDGYVKWILNAASDITELVKLRSAAE